jgi:hypothetical protein
VLLRKVLLRKVLLREVLPREVLPLKDAYDRKVLHACEWPRRSLEGKLHAALGDVAGPSVWGRGVLISLIIHLN